MLANNYKKRKGKKLNGKGEVMSADKREPQWLRLGGGDRECTSRKP